MPETELALGAAYSGREANHALSFRQFNKSKHAQYFTPVWLADLLFELLRCLLPDEDASKVSVLDPTCGSGRLLAPWVAAGATVLGIELDELAATHAKKAIGSTNVRTGDLLDYRSLLSGFSLVLTNPPYGIWWNPPDAGEVWSCETSGGLLESQGATLEICTRALDYGGLLVALIPTSAFQNAKDRSLRDVLYSNFEGILQVTIPKPFVDEYHITLDCDLVVARRVYSSRASDWEPCRDTIDPDRPEASLRAAFRVVQNERALPASRHVPVPVLSRLVSIQPSVHARITPRGVTGSGDVTGLLGFLNHTVTAFDPVSGIERGIVDAVLSPSSLITLGPAAAEETLASLGFAPAIAEKDAKRITRLQEKFSLLRTPLFSPQAHQRLAYLEDRAYPAKNTITDAGQPLFMEGKTYHLRPSWVRNREVAKVETVWDARLEREIQLTTTVDRGYLSITVVTDSGSRVFREVAIDDVRILTDAFELPVVSDLEAVAPRSVERNRRIVAKRAPFLFPFQREDVARMAVKPFGYLGYEQGGGKTVTAAAWAAVRGFRRVLVVCQSSLVENWLNELTQFGFPASRLTTHASVTRLQAEKRTGEKPKETTFFVTSYEFLSLSGQKVYDAWACRSFDKDGTVAHESLDNRKASCSVCKRAYEDVITACPKCSDVPAWTGGFCGACGYRAWTASGDARQWPAYKRLTKLFGAVLVDEAQVAKSKNTLRGRAVRAFRSKGRLILTGTLMKGYPIDVFWNVSWLLGFDTPLFPYAYRGGSKRFLDEFGTYEYVTRQFEESLHEGRAKLLPEVSNLNRFWRLMAAFAVRRRKDDVFELPEKRRRIVLLDLHKEHRELYDAYGEWAKAEIQKALRQNDGNPNMGVISNALWRLRYAATCPVAVDYLDRGVLNATTWNKLDAIVNLVRAAFDKGEKTIVFSGLRVMVAAIAKRFRDLGLKFLPITADVPAAKRFELIQDFSRDPEMSAIVAGLNCLNRGFTITAANHVVLVDLEYSPEATEQAEDRVHRPGQTKPVEITYLLSRDTIDQVMHEILLQKAEAIRHAIDGRARFTDVADLLKRVTGDIQVEIARRISLLPSPAPVIDLVPLPEPEIVTPPIELPSNVIAFPVPEVPITVLPIPAIDPEEEARRRAFWERVAAERKAVVILRRPTRVAAQAAAALQLSLFD
ncbi:MAG: ATP-dependent RNA helicase RhlB [Thermoanaerobaculia bacterium]|nr:ATP-dependent RNA helicase RhlB [Thermoanaerobaculia bacterium]